jgi:membrane protein YqaA with SNARE-associated domain
MTAHLVASAGLYTATFVVCLLAGLIPLINAEVYLVGIIAVGAVGSPSALPAIVLLAALGQMVAKIILYYAALGALELPGGRTQAKIAATRARLDRWRRRPTWVLAVSSTVGLPPFYLVSLAAGALQIRLRTFVTIGMIGRVVHFGVVVALAWWM